MSTTPDADRYSDMKLELACAKCGSAGLIPWQRLDRVLFCHGCSAFLRVEAGGLVELEEALHERISVQVRSSSSKWQHHLAVIEKKLSIASRLGDAAMDLAASKRAQAGAVCAALLLMVGSIALMAHETATPPTFELPKSLDERAVMLTEAIARRDMQILTGLTEPSQHRALRIWLAHGKGLPQPISPDAGKITAGVLSKAKTTAAGDNVELRTRILVPPDEEEFLLDQRWVQLGEVWYFRPIRLRSPVTPVKWRPQKQQRRPTG